MRFTDKVVVITGAGSGIGRVMARMFAAEGARVVIAERDEAAGAATAETITEAGGRALAVTTDVSVGDQVESMVDKVMEALGAVDVLVNNAAVAAADDVLLTEPATWDDDVAVVLGGPFLCSRAVLPHLIDQGGGAIVNIASVNGLSALGNEAYSAAKAGVINFTRAVAMRYGHHGVRANAIAPGTIRTPIWDERIERDPQVFERLVKWYPLGRIGEPEDVATAALFLASDDASWITGTVLRVDGGLLAGNAIMTRELLAMAGDDDQ